MARTSCRKLNPLDLCALVLLLATLAACAPLRQYRPDNSLCTATDLDATCGTHALQELKPADANEPGYLLGFVELDDQGQFFDRKQMDAVVTAVTTEAARPGRDILNVIFVHGWKHSAAPKDGNIEVFRAALRRLAKAEQAVSRATGVPARRVVGVYVGWRGLSITWPVLKELTFWDRKNTAHEVGHGDVTELLNRLELIQRIKNEAQGEPHRSRMVTVGHSFGGALVFSALNQQLAARFIRTTGAPETTAHAEGFGNLVVLINPAFEAQLYSSLRSMSDERGTYFEGQLPVLAVLTSEADQATKLAFPAGRYFSTMFEKERKVTQFNPVLKKNEEFSQHEANRQAVGHFKPYRTHTLRAAGEPSAVADAMRSEAAIAESVRVASSGWDRDAPGNVIPFPGSVLTRGDNTAGRNPYLIVQVDKALIHDHNDISDPRVAEFITQLIMISSQSDNAGERAQERSRGTTTQGR